MVLALTKKKIEEEANNYESLKFFKKSKNVFVSFILFTEGMQLIRASQWDFSVFIWVLSESVIFAILTIFIYFNHRWAIAVFGIYYIIDKILIFSASAVIDGNAISKIILAAIVAVLTYATYRVATNLKGKKV